jgi:hypothetical protein
MQTALPVHTLTDAQRVAEATEILAAGLLRYRQACLNLSKESEFSLDLPPSESVHHDRYHHGAPER